MSDYNSFADEQLVELCRKDDNSAWTVLCGRFIIVSRKKSNLFKNSGIDVDDLVQEGLIGLFGAVHSFDKTKNVSFSAFANVCIKNSILNAVASFKHKNNLPLENFEEENENDYVDTAMTPEELAVSKNEVEFIHSVISGTLSKKEKDVFILFLGGDTYSEISKKLGTSEKSVDGALQRARHKLRKVLGE